MMVTFVSQCEKKAIKHTRRILDAFANRIGDNVWQSVITEDGLIAVKKLLRMKVTKNTAVACHWLRGRSRSELLWIVGTRSKFNHQGIVPVNRTTKSLSQNKWENNWHYLPLIKALVAVAALLHDWGKASVLFQNKLSRKQYTKDGDPLRHEWISCLLLNALVQCSGDNVQDEAWLNLLISQTWDEDKLKQIVTNGSDQAKALDNLPPIAQLVAWLIVSHHRLPFYMEKLNQYEEWEASSIGDLLKLINADSGYKNGGNSNYRERLIQCFEFKQGLLSQSSLWAKQIKKWASRLYQEINQATICIDDGSWRVVLHHARLSLMLGDHYYSSCDHDRNWKTSINLIANTDSKTGDLKQYLDEHLVHVSYHALQVTQSLSRLSEEMDLAYDMRNLKKKSPVGFEWQDQAVSTIKKFILQEQTLNNKGCFIVNMASTGKGKTIANAKIMQAISPGGDSLRYILALGLRTLTLQTGESYRKDIGLANEELAVLIGSKAVQELYDKNYKDILDDNEQTFTDIGSESLENLLENELASKPSPEDDAFHSSTYLLDNEYDKESMPQADFMNVLFPKNSLEKNKAFLYKPVLVCTIDHIMAATETTRGGKYILPCLRLLSSDLVIDEVDDFNSQDLLAITRLVHLVGMLGRKVMISSATIPPALAEGFFNAYNLGWQLYCKFKQIKDNAVISMWVDEFKTQINITPVLEKFQSSHQEFVQARVKQLTKQVIRHKGYIVKCDAPSAHDIETMQVHYFDLIKDNICKLHQDHYTTDKITGKKVSFGVVRVANIKPCVELTRYLLNAEWDTNNAPRIMAYHSRQILVLRNEQENHLDRVLKRKEKLGEPPVAFYDPIIRAHIDLAPTDNVIFIVVATPVEEVGRDHDFDWAIVEPSSYRSIIQLSGRVLRHRKLDQDIIKPNVALMQYNLRALQAKGVAFTRPGFEENNDYFRLNSKKLEQLINVENIYHSITAIPRIQANKPLHPNDNLADLEHAVMEYYLTSIELKGPSGVHGWLNEVWFLTGLPQKYNSFRRSLPNIKLYAILKGKEIKFCEKDEYAFDKYSSDCSVKYKIEFISLNNFEKKRLWLDLNYYDILYNDIIRDPTQIKSIESSLEYRSKRYGEITLPVNKVKDNLAFYYSEVLGLVDRV